MGDVAPENFVLYNTDKGIVIISNEVRVRILDELSRRNLSPTELVNLTGKAQSTLFVHLDSMVKDGVITSWEDPEDNRRKIYSISSLRIAETKTPDSESFEKAREIFADMVDDPDKISNYMIYFLYTIMDSRGLFVGPLAEIIGGIHAQAISGKLHKGPIEDVVGQIIKYYSFANMGKVTIYSFNPLTIIVDTEFKLSRGAAEAMGRYSVGYFFKSLEFVFGTPFELSSSEVFGAENNYFRFVLDRKSL